MRLLISETSWTAAALARGLADDGFLLTRAESPEDLSIALRFGEQDAVILDDSLPDAAASALRTIRARSATGPVAVLAPGAEVARCEALYRHGADLVLSGPVAARELAARLRAMVRRAAGHASDPIAIGDLAIDGTARHVAAAGRTLSLTRIEFEILETLALRGENIVSKETLMTQLYAWTDEPDIRILDVYFCRLRRKIAAAGGDPACIETHFGRGYRLTAAPRRMAAA